MDEQRKKLWDDACNSINALLVASRGRMTIAELEKDYREVIQRPIPFRELGFSSTETFLRNIPNVAKVTGSGSQAVVEVVVTEASRHILKMVKGQKKAKKSKSKSIPPAISQRGKWRGPVPPRFLQNRFPNPAIPQIRPVIPVVGFQPMLVTMPVRLPPAPNPPLLVQGPNPRFQSQPKASASPRTYRDRLEQLTEKFGLEKPEYSTIPRKNEFYGKVTVGSRKYSSTPESSTDREKVLEIAAKEAFEDLSQKFSDDKLKITEDLNLVKQRVGTIVEKKAQGLFYNEVENEYQKRYNEKLPQNWVVLLANDQNSRIRCEQTLKSWIVLPASAEQVFRPVPAAFPDAEYWNVQVDYVEAVVVYAHIADDAAEEAFAEFVDNMELHYSDAAKPIRPAVDIQKGILYVAKITNEFYRWERVVVEETLETGVRVRLVDRGDVLDIEKDRLFPITKEFAQLPCQVIRCELFGLSAVGEVDAVLLEASTLCDGSQFLAEIVSFEPLNVILYNEAGNNMNVNILLQAAEKLPPPSLPSSDSVSNIYLQHVTSSGDVYVQLDRPINSVVACLLDIISRVAATTEAPVPAEVATTKRYLALNPSDSKWYRANVISNPTVNLQVAVYFIDTGNTQIIPVSDLRDLSQVCPELQDIPELAIRVRLARIPPSPELEFTEKAAKRLRELVPKNTAILMRIIQLSPPLVELYKRLESKELIYINTTLELEPSLFSQSKETSRTPSPLETLGRKLSSSSISSRKEKATPTTPPPATPASPKAPAPAGVVPLLQLPKVGDQLPLMVLNASHPQSFWVQPLSSSKALNALMIDMQEWYNQPELTSAVVDHSAVHVNGFYAAYHQQSGFWHRVKVTAVMGASALVHLIDYGDTYIVMPNSPLYPLKAEFCQLPAQAIQAKLAGIKPRYGDWTVESILFFKTFEEKQLYGRVESIQENRVLSLELIDVSGDEDLYVSLLLVEKEHAAKA